MGLFSFLRKKNRVEQVVETVQRINFEELYDVDDHNLTKLATSIINGEPLIVNLEKIDIDSANKVIAFLSGVIYAIEGYVLPIKEKVFLFGNSEVYDDGSVRKLVDELI